MATEDDDIQRDVEHIQPPGEQSVTLTEDDAEPAEREDDGDGQPPAEATRDPKTGKWSKKHRERGEQRKGMRQELEGLRTEKSALQQRLDSMERGNQTQQQLFAALIQRLGQPNGQQQREPQPTADDHALDAIEAKMETELAAISQDAKRPVTEYRKMERERARIIARMEAGAILKQQPRQEQSQGDVPPQYAYRNEIMTTEFPWLKTDEKAVKAAQNYRNYLLANDYPDTIETDRLACAHVAAERKLGGPARPSQRTQRAMGGLPTGGVTPRANAPRAVSLPAAVLKGTGLSKSVLAQIALSGDDE